MEKQAEKYIYALDLSLNSTGVCIFDSRGDVKKILTIEINGEKETQKKLEIIGKKFIELQERYPPEKVIIEQGFTRYNQSTQQIFRVHGIVNYLFSDYEQIYYPASSVKKAITGKGNASKEDVRQVIKWEYPEVNFLNYDESDAFALGIVYFMENGEHNGKKNYTK